MENLIVEGSKGTFFIPTIKFDGTSGKCEISGESYLEDTMKFYAPVVDWLAEYAEMYPKGALEMKIRLNYFNTSSSRALSLILQTLKKFEEKGGDVEVVWYHKPDDDDMIEEIEDFMEESGLDIILYPHEQVS